MSSKKIAVVLSGCGYLDGAEIREAVITLLELDKQGAETKIFSPKKEVQEVNHFTNEPTGERIDSFEMSARIARGELEELSKLKAEDFDGVVFPGGFGAAKHLCDFAEKGPEMSVTDETKRVLMEFYNAGKPIGAMCIAPVLLAKTFGDQLDTPVKLTIGNDEGTASACESWGARHENCGAASYIKDETHKMATTPAYMLEAPIAEIAKGIAGCVYSVLEMTKPS